MAISRKATPVLSLTTLTTRQVVEIDNKRYEMRNVGELTALGYEEQARKFYRLGELLEVKKPSKAHSAERSKLLAQLSELVLLAPTDVHKRLDDFKRLQIITAFSTLLPPSGLATGAKKAPAGRR